MPNFEFTVTSPLDTYPPVDPDVGVPANLTISPQAYLIDSPTSDICLSLIVVSESGGMVLGAPFFRSYGIELNYATTDITIKSGDKTS